jgi:non-ribosomal peptide synthetase-like protein
MTDSTIDGSGMDREVALGRSRAELKAAPLARTLLDVFAATAARCANRMAIDAPDASLTYGELWDAARGLAEQLTAAGIGPGDRIGIRVPSGTAELYVAILGTLHAGAAYVPIDAEDPPERAETILEASSACALLEAGLTPTLLGPVGGAGHPLGVHDDAWIVFTSGSTGAPKGVAVTHRAAAAFVDAEAGLWAVTPEDRVLASLSVSFDASCEEMWLAWRNGAALVPAPRERVRAGAELGHWVTEQRVTVISTVPSLAAMWDEADLSGVRLLILGGEACPEPLAWRLAAGREVWNTYGPTEATVVSTAARMLPGANVTIGWPLRGWEVTIADESGQPVALGEPGELVIAGVGLGRYLDPELDADAYAPLPALGWKRAYRTGDIVRETVDGLEFLGRRDNQVKLGGRRIELGEVEAQLNAVPGVRAAAAAVKRTEAGNPVLVGYVVGDVDPSELRTAVARRLPQGAVPMIVALDALPMSRAGKVDRRSLPWPPPRPADAAAPGLDRLGPTATWLAEQWAAQLGPHSFSAASDFFELGGSSLAAAKLVSAVRRRFPAVAVSDVYNHRTLGELAARLDGLDSVAQEARTGPAGGQRRWAAVQLAGVVALIVLTSPQWVLGLLALNELSGGALGPKVGWLWLILGWAIFVSPPGKAAIIVAARRLLLPDLAPGRYPRRGWLSSRIWFLERLGDAYRSEALAGTPFAARFARLCGHPVGTGARLGVLPPVTSLVSIGERATIEADADIHGWWLEGEELIVDEIKIGAEARVGARALVSPGVDVGERAEIEPGSVVHGVVPAGERWGGSPAVKLGDAAAGWPAGPPPRVSHARLWRSMFLLGLSVQSVLPVLAAGPGLLILYLTGAESSAHGFASTMITEAPILAASFLIAYALLTALLVRATGALIQPGYHPDEGSVGWALWFSEGLMGAGRGTLFSLYSSLYIRPFLRLAGVPVGRRAEVSTAVGANRLTRLAEESFVADDVAFGLARARRGWLHVAPIEVGRGSFLGNGAILNGDTAVGRGCMVGVLTTSPQNAPDGTSWLGFPALELPRVPDCPDPERTLYPPRRLLLARAAMELIRILLPASMSVVLAALVIWALEAVMQTGSLADLILAVPVLLLGAGIVAVAFTVAAKWLLMGRYRAGVHPLWSFFVWRDEILNSLQDQLAGAWLLGLAMATPLMGVYLRAMGSKVGRDVWCDTLTITEFDMVELGDGSVVNRFACVETHLFHDRLMRIGPTRLGPGSTLGPASALLPDTVLGAGVTVGGRSVVLRGEELPPGTRWHGSPVVAA